MLLRQCPGDMGMFILPITDIWCVLCDVLREAYYYEIKGMNFHRQGIDMLTEQEGIGETDTKHLA